MQGAEVPGDARRQRLLRGLRRAEELPRPRAPGRAVLDRRRRLRRRHGRVGPRRARPAAVMTPRDRGRWSRRVHRAIDVGLTAAARSARPRLALRGGRDHRTGALAAALVLFMPVWTPGSYLVREYSRHVEGFAGEAAGAERRRSARTPGASRRAARRASSFATASTRTSSRSGRATSTRRTPSSSARPSSWASRATRSSARASSSTRRAAGARRRSLPRTARRRRRRGLRFDAPTSTRSSTRPSSSGRTARSASRCSASRTATPSGRLDGVRDARRAPPRRRTRAPSSRREAKLFGGALPLRRLRPPPSPLAARARRPRAPRQRRAHRAARRASRRATAYLDLLSLVAHEVFHAWNVKRIRPAGLTPYRYERGVLHAPALVVRGSDELLRLAGARALSRLCTRRGVPRSPGRGDRVPRRRRRGAWCTRSRTTSFDAWIKLYRPDENSANSSVSYYRKGEVVCALLDLEIRARSGGRASLDARARAPLGGARRSEPARPGGRHAGDLRARRRRAPRATSSTPGSARPLGASTTARDAGARRASRWSARARPDAATCSLGVRVRTEAARAYVASVTRESRRWRAGHRRRRRGHRHRRDAGRGHEPRSVAARARPGRHGRGRGRARRARRSRSASPSIRRARTA